MAHAAAPDSRGTPHKQRVITARRRLDPPLAGGSKHIPLLVLECESVGTSASQSPRFSGCACQQRLVPTGAVNYSLSPEVCLDFTLGRKTRFPSLREAYNGALGRFVPNPESGPETAVSVALGVVGQHSGFDWEVRGFATETSDGITRVPLPNGQFTRVNLTSSRIFGFEFGLEMEYDDWLQARVEGTVLRARAW